MRNFPAVLIVGGGPAGAACAIRLRKHGVEVHLAEKEVFPRRKVCGCCLGGAGLAAVESLGLREFVVETGVALDRWRGAMASRMFEVPLPSGVAISRERFDSRLLEQAERVGAMVHHEAIARVGESNARGVDVQLKHNGSTSRRRYDCVVLATGLNAGGAMGALPWKTPPHGPFGVSLTASAGDFEPGVIYMACDDDGYTGAVVLEDGRLDVAAALRSGAVAARGGTPRQRAQRILTRSGLCDRELDDVSPAITTPPLRRLRLAGQGPILAIGDAAGYVEPFTGEGMTWAMESGVAAADRIASSIDRESIAAVGDRWQRELASLLRFRRVTCGAVTTALRWSVTRYAVGRTIAAFPLLARPLVQHLNTPH